MKFNFSLLLVVFFYQVNGQVIIVNNPADLPLDDLNSTVSTESDRFGNDTYIYGADFFTLTESVELDTATFYGEKIIGSFPTISAFSIYIMENNTNNQPNLNPNTDSALIHLERVLPGEGMEVLFENGDDEMDIGIDFTVANQGTPVVLPPGDYWLVAAVYSPDADAGDPTLSWQWRYSTNISTHKPQRISHSNPVWEEIPFDNATSMAWELTAEPILSVIENQLNNEASVYPNPTYGILNIAVANNIEISQVSVYEMNGKRINLENPTNSSLDISNLPKGIYLLQLQTTKAIIHKKIIKN